MQKQRKLHRGAGKKAGLGRGLAAATLLLGCSSGAAMAQATSAPNANTGFYLKFGGGVAVAPDLEFGDSSLDFAALPFEEFQDVIDVQSGPLLAFSTPRDTGFFVELSPGIDFGKFRTELNIRYSRNGLSDTSVTVTDPVLPASLDPDISDLLAEPGTLQALIEEFNGVDLSGPVATAGELQSVSALLNLYYDKNIGDRLTLSAGGGGGIYVGVLDLSFPLDEPFVDEFGEDVQALSILDNRVGVDFTWQIGAAASYALNRHVFLEFSYRFQRAGGVVFEDIANFAGAEEALPGEEFFEDPEVRVALDANQHLLGAALRFQF